MKAVIFNTNTGSIERTLSGAVPMENQRLSDDEAILTDEEVAFPDTLQGKLVDGSSSPPEFVNDPNHEKPKTTRLDRAKISEETRNHLANARLKGDLQAQLDEVYRILDIDQDVIG